MLAAFMTLAAWAAPRSRQEMHRVAARVLSPTISFDGKTAIMSQIDEAMEHHILLMKTGYKDTDIDKFFRIVLDKSGADWTFVCPPDYKGIQFKDKRIEAFYKDGFAVISDFLHSIGYPVGIDIPKRYRRHLDVLGKDNY